MILCQKYIVNAQVNLYTIQMVYSFYTYTLCEHFPDAYLRARPFKKIVTFSFVQWGYKELIRKQPGEWKMVENHSLGHDSSYVLNNVNHNYFLISTISSQQCPNFLPIPFLMFQQSVSPAYNVSQSIISFKQLGSFQQNIIGLILY